jgi:hypothetical protein
MTDHADLIRRAREHAETLERTGCGTQAGLYRGLADALERVVREREMAMEVAAKMWVAELERDGFNAPAHPIVNIRTHVAACLAVRDAVPATEGGAK